MIFSKADGRGPFVYDDENFRSFYVEDKFDNLVGTISYEWGFFLTQCHILMLAPTVIDRWDDE